jgi:hypothetical protein
MFSLAGRVDVLAEIVGARSHGVLSRFESRAAAGTVQAAPVHALERGRALRAALGALAGVVSRPPIADGFVVVVAVLLVGAVALVVARGVDGGEDFRPQFPVLLAERGEVVGEFAGCLWRS